MAVAYPTLKRDVTRPGTNDLWQSLLLDARRLGGPELGAKAEATIAGSVQDGTLRITLAAGNGEKHGFALRENRWEAAR